MPEAQPLRCDQCGKTEGHHPACILVAAGATAQPGQEQRMETVCSECDPPGSGQECRGGPCGSCNGTGITRPTADLGELVERVGKLLACDFGDESDAAIDLAVAAGQMRDRLILYREALAAVEHAESVEIARDIAGALLSRSGDD